MPASQAPSLALTQCPRPLFVGSLRPNPSDCRWRWRCGPRAKPRPQGSLIFAPACSSAPPLEALAGEGCNLLCLALRGSGEWKRPPSQPSCLGPQPLPPLGVSCSPPWLGLPAPGSLVRSLERQEVGRRPAAPSSPARRSGEPSRESWGTHRRLHHSRSCGLDCSSGQPASCFCSRGARPEVTPRGNRLRGKHPAPRALRPALLSKPGCRSAPASLGVPFGALSGPKRTECAAGWRSACLPWLGPPWGRPWGMGGTQLSQSQGANLG